MPGERPVQVPEGGTVHTCRGRNFLASGFALPRILLWHSFQVAHGALWERGRKRVGGCYGSERSEMRFEIVQKNCTTTNLPVRHRMEKTRFYGFGM